MLFRLMRWWSLRPLARELRRKIRNARDGRRPPLRSLPPFPELLEEAARLRAGGYDVEVEPEVNRRRPGYRPERVHLLPAANGRRR